MPTNNKKPVKFNPVKQDADGKQAKRMIWSSESIELGLKGLEEGRKLIANPFYENNTKLPKIINCDEPSEKYLTIIKMNILNGMDDSEEEYKSLYTYWYQNAHPVSDLLPYALILANREHRSNDLSEYNDYIYNCLMSNESLMLLTDKLDTVTLAMAQKYRYK